jgi:hypothetical protein
MILSARYLDDTSSYSESESQSHRVTEASPLDNKLKPDSELCTEWHRDNRDRPVSARYQRGTSSRDRDELETQHGIDGNQPAHLNDRHSKVLALADAQSPSKSGCIYKFENRRSGQRPPRARTEPGTM